MNPIKVLSIDFGEKESDLLLVIPKVKLPRR